MVLYIGVTWRIRLNDLCSTDDCRLLKLEFHDADTDTDIIAWILADTTDTRDFLQVLAKRMSVSVSASWNASLITLRASGSVYSATVDAASRGSVGVG